MYHCLTKSAEKTGLIRRWVLLTRGVINNLQLELITFMPASAEISAFIDAEE